MTDFLEEKKREINARLKELRPLVDEFHRLEAAADPLDGVGGGRSTAAASGGTPTPRGRAGGASRPPRRAASGSSGSGRRRRPRGSGTRSIPALELVRSRPGISI